MDGSLTNNDDFMSYHDGNQMQRIPGVNNMEEGEDSIKFGNADVEGK